MTIVEQTVAVGDALIYVRAEGRDDAPPLLLANSMGTQLSMWQAQMDALKQQFRVIRYDIRGHGQSRGTPPPYDLALLAGDAIAVLDALGIARAHFCGVSIGGMIAEHLIVHHRDRFDRVVIANAGVFIPSFAVAPRIEAAEQQGLTGLVDTIVPRWFTQPFIDANPDVIEGLKKEFCENSFDGYLGCCHALATLDYRGSIGSTTTPVLVIGGEHDPATKPEHSRELADMIPGARLVMLDCAHLSNIERPAEFTQAVLDFLGES